MIGWKLNNLEEYDNHIDYVEGKTKYVADALSRPNITCNSKEHMEIDSQSRNQDLQEENVDSDAATVHSPSEDNSLLILIIECPLNIFKAQIIIRQGNSNKTNAKKLPLNKTRKEFIIQNPYGKFYEYVT